MKAALSLLVLVTGCVEMPHASTVSVRALRAKADGASERGVAVGVKSVTPSTWKSFPDLIDRVQWEEANKAQASEIGVGIGKGTGGGAMAASSRVIRAEDVPLTVLPAFLVRVENHSGHALKLDAAGITLDDGHGHAFKLLAGEELASQVRRATIDKLHLDPAMQANQKVITGVLEAAANVPQLGAGRQLADGEAWQGYLPFHVELERPVETMTLHLDGLQLDGASGPAFALGFVVERKRNTRKCPDGAQPSALGVCPSDAGATDPADDGPCIQETAKPNTQLRNQYWIDATAVADSDVHRTLLADRVSHKPMRQSLVLKWVGWTLLVVGVAAATATAVGIERQVGAQRAPAALSLLAISAGGLGMVAGSNRKQEEAVRKFNELSDATGVCAPVW